MKAIQAVLREYEKTASSQEQKAMAEAAWAEVHGISLEMEHEGAPADVFGVALVSQFHQAMGLPVSDFPAVGTEQSRTLRVRLMLEEVLEFAAAAGVQVSVADGVTSMSVVNSDLKFATDPRADLAQMAHELGDIQYVVAGTAAELGLPLRGAVPIIHQANMRKLGPDGKPIVVDGKIRKPDGWQPADVSHLVR